MRLLSLSLAIGLLPAVAACATKDAGSTGAPAAGTGGSMAATGGAPAGSGGSNGGDGVLGGGGSGVAGTGGAGEAGRAGAPGGGAGAGGDGGSGAGSAGTGGSAGSGDAGGSAGGGAGSAGTAGASGGPTDPCATALFCDDFESHPLGAPPGGMWNEATKDGAIAVDDTFAASGTKSVQITTAATGSSRTALIRLDDTSLFPIAGNKFYGRMMFRLQAAPTESVHWTFIQAGGTVPNDTYRALYRYGGQHPQTQGQTFVGSQLMANYETPDWYSNMSTPGSDCWQHANGTVLPTSTFVCVEWLFDGPNDEMRLWLDGEAIDSLTVAGSGDGCVNASAGFAWTAPEFSSLDLGWEAYQPDDAREAYVDDVVISLERVGCPTP